MRNILCNDAFTTLDGAIDDSQTTFDVVDGSIFAPDPDYYPSTGLLILRCDDELMLCTGIVSNTLTVVRGHEGTTPAAHSSGEDVVHVLTVDGLYRHGADNVGMFGIPTMPPLNRIYADTPPALLTASDFSWTNQGGASATDQHGTILLTAPPASGNELRWLGRTAPSAPYSYVAAFRQSGFRNQGGNSVPNFSFGFRDSSGKLQTITVLIDGTTGSRMQISTWSGPSSAPTATVERSNYGLIGPDLWLKIEDDNTDLIYSIGDGLAWVPIYSAGRTSHFASGPDEVGFGANNASSAAAWDYMVRLVSWSRES